MARKSDDCRGMALDTALLLYLLPDREEPYTIRDVITTRYGGNISNMRGRINRCFDRSLEEPADRKGLNGSRRWYAHQYRSSSGWSDNEKRVEKLLCILRWVANQVTDGPHHDGRELFEAISRYSPDSLMMVIDGLANKNAIIPDRFRDIAQWFRDLSIQGRDEFWSMFGTGPILDIERRDPHEQTNTGPVVQFPRKWAFWAVAIVFFTFIAASPVRLGVVLDVLDSDGIKAASRYAVRSGLFHWDAPIAIRTSAYLQYRKGDYRDAIFRARQLLAIPGIPKKLEGDAYLVTGHSYLAVGDVSSSLNAYSNADEAYLEPSALNRSSLGMARCYLVLGERQKALDALCRAEEYNKACNYNGNLVLQYEIKARLDDDPIGVSKDWLEYFDKNNMVDGLIRAHSNLGYFYALKRDRDKAIYHTIYAQGLIDKRGDLVESAFNKVNYIVLGLDSPLIIEEIQSVIDKGNVELERLINDLPQL